MCALLCIFWLLLGNLYLETGKRCGLYKFFGFNHLCVSHISLNTFLVDHVPCGVVVIR